MKYKLELWKYDYFSWREAEEHLNKMAEKGYRFRYICSPENSTACYQRDEAAKGKRYTIDIHYDNDSSGLADYYQLYKDSGWNLVYSEDDDCGGFCIFESSTLATPKPPYYDQGSREEAMTAMLETEDKISSKWINAICYILVVVLNGMGMINGHYGEDKPSYLLYVLLILLAILGITELIEAVGNQMHLNRTKNIDLVEPYPTRSTLLVKCKALNYYTSVGVAIGLWAIFTMEVLYGIFTGAVFDGKLFIKIVAIVVGPVAMVGAQYLPLFYKRSPVALISGAGFLFMVLVGGYCYEGMI